MIDKVQSTSYHEARYRKNNVQYNSSCGSDSVYNYVELEKDTIVGILL